MSIQPVNIVTIEENTPYMNCENVENIDEIRPSTRLTDRRSGIINSFKPNRRNTMGLCSDCYHSIYDNEDYYFCKKCREKLCVTCWEKNTKCPKCGRKIKKSNNWIPVKEGSWLWKLIRKFTKCFFCLPNQANI